MPIPPLQDSSKEAIPGGENTACVTSLGLPEPPMRPPAAGREGRFRELDVWVSAARCLHRVPILHRDMSLPLGYAKFPTNLDKDLVGSSQLQDLREVCRSGRRLEKIDG